MKEIGSEFWLEEKPEHLLYERDGVYVLSGRTAIDVIIQNIILQKRIKNVYMPAYCCDSMIAPFLNRGIEIELYDVEINSDGTWCYHIDTDKDVEIFYINNYFGFENIVDESVIKHFKKKGSIIIYDKTHSFLMNNDLVVSDYAFASIRKWMGVIGGAIVDGVDSILLKDYPYLSCKEYAMLKKASYINGDLSIPKEDFLRAYSEFGLRLESDYQNYKMDDLSYTIFKKTNFEKMQKARKTNARFLYDNLNVTFLFEFTRNTCPLFVPIIFNTQEQRDTVRKKLIDAQIYCPVHWPKHRLLTEKMKVNKIFETELSLICDQRYTECDMERIVEIINN